MLYDILPPVAFLGSLGGIVWIISRVVARIRHTELSDSITSVAEEHTTDSTTKIQPEQSRIHLLTNRREWVGGMFKQLKTIPSLIAPATKRTGMFLKQATATWQAKRADRKAQRVAKAEAEQILSTQPVKEEALTPGPIVLRRVDKKEEVTVPPPQTVLAPPRTLTGRKVTSPTFFKKKPTISLLTQAEEAISQAQYEEAENLLVPYIFKHTKDTTAYMLLGQVAVARNNWEEALEIFEQVVSRNKNEPGVWASLGEAAHRSGHLSRALQALQRAHEADPTNEKVLEYLLQIAHRMDNQGLTHSIQTKISNLKTIDQVPV